MKAAKIPYKRPNFIRLGPFLFHMASGTAYRCKKPPHDVLQFRLRDDSYKLYKIHRISLKSLVQSPRLGSISFQSKYCT
ncbi:hypothetical protein BDV36DRAFT_252328 [Aspergillus pseudocaelatus]|uniref:Uncharacterized protein n=1 Tax=Aspergillus pseudocaelatus TaxID=1825620 RepID=A0ABQ6WPK0_9EURO|nr:hypothetical protein BDV36DRAFT_252328 [Aspergillus pseudocaelatus]